MATITAQYNRSIRQPTNSKQHNLLTDMGKWLRVDWSEQSPALFVLGMAGYFLLLGSIAVIVLSNQFPWFIAAPITILTAVAYILHGDAKHSQQRSRS